MEAERRQLAELDAEIRQLAELEAVLRDIGVPERWQDMILSPELRRIARRSYDIEPWTQEELAAQEAEPREAEREEAARWAAEGEARMGGETSIIRCINISDDHIRDNNSITSTCSICHNDYVLGEEAGQLHCGHIYHQDCIRPWINFNHNCPICRSST